MAVIQPRPTHILYQCAYLKNWTDNFFQIFVMGTSWVAVSINNITTRASREMASRKNIKSFDFNGVNVAKHWHVAGEVFAISDCLVYYELRKYQHLFCQFHWCCFQVVCYLFSYFTFFDLSIGAYIMLHSLFLKKLFSGLAFSDPPPPHTVQLSKYCHDCENLQILLYKFRP